MATDTNYLRTTLKDRKRWILGGLLGIAASFLLWGVATSQGFIPAGDGTISGCFKTHKNSQEGQGQLRVVSDTENCSKSETPIQWGRSEGRGSIIESGFVSFLVIASSTSTPPTATSTPIGVTVTVRVNKEDTALEATAFDDDVPGTFSNTTDSVDVDQGDLISIRFTRNGAALPPIWSITGNSCGGPFGEDVCTMVVPRSGTLTNLFGASNNEIHINRFRVSMEFR